MQMPYSRLYLRMALHIGAALAAFVLIGAASLGLIAAAELRNYVQTRQSSLAFQAADVLATGGEAALVDWLGNEAEIPTDVSIYVLDANSNDLLGGELPGEYAEFVRDSVIGQPEEPGSNYRPVRLAPQLVAPDGSVYAFLVLPKSISLWGSPAITLGLLVVALIVIASVAWLIARAYSRPIGDLQLAVRELTSGNSAARAPTSLVQRKDELGALAADFNSMADRLTGLIEGRESLLREMSHELRSPLARLQAALALAAARDSISHSERDRIEQEIGRMNRVIGEMLRYSSLGATVNPKRRLVRIDRLLKELVAVEEIEATGRNCKLKLDATGDLTVIGDPELLASGFENIVRNAIRYAPPESLVEITARRQQTYIEIHVADRGPGVPQEHLQAIFEPYFRIADGDHDQDSTGLGLAIVRRVVEHHNGTVSALQRDAGGLIIAVRLPAADLD